MHFRWRSDLKPVAEVEQEEDFELSIPDSSTMQVREDYTTADMGRIDGSKFDAAVGPVWIRGAEPGDALAVEIREIVPGSWGWSAILRDFGLLKGEFEERLVIWDIGKDSARTRGSFLRGVEVPVKPFLGVTGTAPSSGEFSLIPPQYFGGNMDNRLLTAGSTLVLPVFQRGALLSAADPHASQGDGEICGTAIETSARVRLRARVIRGGAKQIWARCAEAGRGSVLISMGIHSDIREAARNAVRGMIDRLAGHGYSPDEAYILCSVSADLRISEIVDEPNTVVSCIIPEALAFARQK